jgi:hypothetical protein
MELAGIIRRARDSQCQNEEILIPSQGVISEIRMASILRTPCPDSPTCGLQVAYRRLTPGIEERQSKCDRRKNVRVDFKPAVEEARSGQSNFDR